MQLKKLFQVNKLTIDQLNFTLSLQDLTYLQVPECPESEAVFDQATLNRFGLPENIELVRHDLVCLLEVIPLPTDQDGHVDLAKIDNDCVLIEEIFHKSGQMTYIRSPAPLWRTSYQFMILRVVSFLRVLAKHATAPSYLLNMALTKREFAMLTALSKETMLKMSWRLPTPDDYLVTFRFGNSDAIPEDTQLQDRAGGA